MKVTKIEFEYKGEGKEAHVIMSVDFAEHVSIKHAVWPETLGAVVGQAMCLDYLVKLMRGEVMGDGFKPVVVARKEWRIA